MKTDPADRCPFARPFSADFDDCSTFLPEKFTPVDSGNRPLAPALTCANLSVGRLPGEEGSFYGRCRLGTAEDRLRLTAVARSGVSLS